MSRAGRLVDVAEAPAEALRLVGALGDDLARAGRPDARALVTALAAAVRAGGLPGAVWVGPKDEAVGLCWGEAPSEVGRRISVYLAEGYRGAGALAGLLGAVAATGGPVIEVRDLAPEPGARAASLRELGFVPVDRVEAFWPRGRPAPAVATPAGGALRPAARDDAPRLGRLLDRAYATNPTDRALFARRRDPAADARELVAGLLHGAPGPWLPEGSWVAWADGEAVGATIANDLDGALLTEVMVAPGARRRGWARALLARSVAGLGPSARSIRLVVTLANAPARALYSAFGFEERPATAERAWLAAAPGVGLAPGP